MGDLLFCETVNHIMIQGTVEEDKEVQQEWATERYDKTMISV